MSQPLISIIVPCYNQAQYLDDCLQSVLDQTYQNWECIVVNDGSTDNSGKVGKKWQQKDNRFSYLEQDNKGVAYARNIGLDKAKGQWIQFLDGDDILLPSKIQESLSFGKEYNFVYTDFSLMVNEKTEKPFCDLLATKLSLENLLRYWDNGLNLPIHTPLISRQIIGNLRFKTEFTLHEDWLFWIELFKKEHVKIKFINKPLVMYRMHLTNSSHNISLLSNNQMQVYNYAYTEILNATEKTLLFEKFVGTYYSVLEKKLFYEKFYFQIKNSRLFKIKLVISKIISRRSH